MKNNKITNYVSVFVMAEFLLFLITASANTAFGQTSATSLEETTKFLKDKIDKYSRKVYKTLHYTFSIEKIEGCRAFS